MKTPVCPLTSSTLSRLVDQPEINCQMCPNMISYLISLYLKGFLGPFSPTVYLIGLKNPKLV